MGENPLDAVATLGNQVTVVAPPMLLHLRLAVDDNIKEDYIGKKIEQDEKTSVTITIMIRPVLETNVTITINAMGVRY